MKCLVALLSLTIGVAPSLGAHDKAVMTAHAKGTFDVKVLPQPADDVASGPFGRLFLDKQLHGDLDAHSNGQMLAWGTGAENSGAYVALERVSGDLHGRRGSFVLQHNLNQRGYAAPPDGTPDDGPPERECAACSICEMRG